MRILVIYGNQDLMLKARPIFEKENHHFVFIKDNDIDFDKLDYDIIFSLHCKKVFPKELVTETRCINIHPGYNPYNRGMFPHVWSIINGLPAGATIHEMDEQIDHGKILSQRIVPIDIYDTSLTLYKKVIECELSLLEMSLPLILSGKLIGYDVGSDGNYNSLEDYKKLCEIDLSKHYTTINLLRALSHGDYKNARIGKRYLKFEIL